MKNIKYFFFLFVLIFYSCNENNLENISFEFSVSENYPTWLKDSVTNSDQTSGITFIGRNGKNEKVFLLCDDIGDLYRFSISKENIFSLQKLVFSEEVNNYLSKFPKFDFEEIVFDKFTNKVYLSIEGNSERNKNNYKDFVGIYELIFNNNSPFSDTIKSIKKLNIKPNDLFLKYTNNNFGYEGLAVDENYFYLGLEGFAENNFFADSTIIFIVNKNDLNIIKEISTKEFGIHTICGLYSKENRKLYGVDRNNRKLFYIEFEKDLTVKNYFLKNIPISIPGYPDIDYTAAIESICFDDKNNIYLIDDPWKRFYIPQGETSEKLDSLTMNNFKKYIPIIYKLNLETNSER